MSLFWNFFDAGSQKKDAKHTVIHTPIFSADNDDMRPVITILPPPELHLLI